MTIGCLADGCDGTPAEGKPFCTTHEFGVKYLTAGQVIKLKNGSSVYHSEIINRDGITTTIPSSDNNGEFGNNRYATVVAQLNLQREAAAPSQSYSEGTSRMMTSGTSGTIMKREKFDTKKTVITAKLGERVKEFLLQKDIKMEGLCTALTALHYFGLSASNESMKPSVAEAIRDAVVNINAKKKGGYADGNAFIKALITTVVSKMNLDPDTETRKAVVARIYDLMKTIVGLVDLGANKDHLLMTTEYRNFMHGHGFGGESIDGWTTIAKDVIESRNEVEKLSRRVNSTLGCNGML